MVVLGKMWSICFCFGAFVTISAISEAMLAFLFSCGILELRAAFYHTLPQLCLPLDVWGIRGSQRMFARGCTVQKPITCIPHASAIKRLKHNRSKKIKANLVSEARTHRT